MRLFGFLPTGMLPVRQREVTPTPGVPSSTMPKEQSKTVTGGDYQERIAYVRGPEQALVVGAVYRAVNLRADTMGVMPVQYQKRDFEKGNYYVDMRGLGKRLNYLLQEEPNPIMSASVGRLQYEYRSLCGYHLSDRPRLYDDARRAA